MSAKKTSKSKETNLECDQCHKLFKTEKYLKTHLLIHSGQQPHKCNHCDARFNSKSHLKGHELIHTGAKPHECTVCQRKFTKKSHLNQHMLVHTDEKPHKCKICGKFFRHKSYLTVHIGLHSGEKTHKCSVCDKTFTQKTHLTKHYMTHTGEKPFKCEICGKGFDRRNRYQIHLDLHSGRPKNECHICQYQCLNQTELKIHFRSHTGVNVDDTFNEYIYESEYIDSPSDFIKASMKKEISTTECTEPVSSIKKEPSDVSNMVLLNRPEITVTVIEGECQSLDEKGKCESSDKKDTETQKSEKTSTIETSQTVNFDGENGQDMAPVNSSKIKIFKIQSLVDKEKKYYKCFRCGAEYTLESHLKIHKLAHMFIKSLISTKCDICSKNCHNRKSLKNHLLTCSVRLKTPQKCSHCQEEFNCPIQLKEHETHHTTPATVTCDICQKKFIGEDVLANHMKTHETESEVYTCTVCGKCFKQKSYLTQHEKQHSSADAHECHMCHKRYATGRLLQRHVQTHSDTKHQCPMCEKTFAMATYLKKHLRTHTGDNPFKCEICEKAYDKRERLRTHMKIHAPGNHCRVCGVTCLNQENLRRHLVMHTELRNAVQLQSKSEEQLSDPEQTDNPMDDEFFPGDLVESVLIEDNCELPQASILENQIPEPVVS